MLYLRLLILCTLLLSNNIQARSFDAEGSDLLMGIGPQNMAMAGAVVASTNDVYASYWNPAGLSEIKGISFSVAKQLNAKLIPRNFIGIAAATDWLRPFALDSTVAFSFIPRLHIKAKGAFQEDEFESIFIRYALPNLPSDFDGDIESKTKDHRFSWAIAPENDAKWRFGMAISYIECASSFCGVTANDPGNYTLKSTDASAWAVHVGGKYYYNDELTFGATLKDLNTKLDVEIITTDNSGTRSDTYETKFPRDLTLAVAWKYSNDLLVTNDLQFMYGSYGTYNIDFRIWRCGINYEKGSWSYRGGLLTPLYLESKKIENIDLPFPTAPTIGIGWNKSGFSVDAVLYAHPIMSTQRKTVYPAMDLSLSFQF